MPALQVSAAYHDAKRRKSTSPTPLLGSIAGMA